MQYSFEMNSRDAVHQAAWHVMKCVVAMKSPKLAAVSDEELDR